MVDGGSGGAGKGKKGKGRGKAKKEANEAAASDEVVGGQEAAGGSGCGEGQSQQVPPAAADQKDKGEEASVRQEAVKEDGGAGKDEGEPGAKEGGGGEERGKGACQEEEATAESTGDVGAEDSAAGADGGDSKAGHAVQDEEAGESKADGKKDREEPPPEQGKSVGNVLRDDEECFLADYTKVSEPGAEVKLTVFEEPVTAWIARELVDMDEDVSLAVRSGPGKTEEEVGVVSSSDTIVVVGRQGPWALLEGEPRRYVMAYSGDGQPLLKQRPKAVTSATAVKLVGSVATSAWSLLTSATAVTGGTSATGESISKEGALHAGGGDGAAATKEGGGGGAASEKVKKEAEAPRSGWSGGGGWGFGGLVSTLSAGATKMAESIVNAGADLETASGENVSPEGKFPRPVPDEAQGHKASEATSFKVADASAAGQEIASSIAEGIQERFDKDVEIEEGGLSSVRYVSQGISMLESSLGWLGSTAKDSINKIDQNKVDALVDQAWSKAKEGVTVSSKTLSTASQAAQQAAQAAQHTASGLKDKINTGSKLVSKTLAEAARGKSEADRPNLKLGGALGIQLSGVLLPRLPIPDEDSDPLLQHDDLEELKPQPFALKAIASLVEERFQEDVFLIAVASPGVQARMLRWLAVHEVYEQTGLTRDRVHLCREEDEQVDVCRQLELSHMIEVSEKAAGALKGAVDDVFVIGQGAIESIVQGAEDKMHELHSDEFEVWWSAAVKHLLPLSAEAVGDADESLGQASGQDGEVAEGDEVAEASSS